MINSKKRETRLTKLLNYATSFDRFGSGMGLQIKGRETFGTLVGLIATLCIYSIVFVYAVNKLTKLIQRGDTTYQRQIEEAQLDKTISFAEIEMNMSFGLIGATDFEPVPEIDHERYVRLEAIMLSYKPSANGL